MPLSSEVRKRRRQAIRARFVREHIAEVGAQDEAGELQGQVADVYLSTDDEECHEATEVDRRKKNKRIREESTPYGDYYQEVSNHSSSFASAQEGPVQTSACSTTPGDSDKSDDLEGPPTAPDDEGSESGATSEQDVSTASTGVDTESEELVPHQVQGD